MKPCRKSIGFPKVVSGKEYYSYYEKLKKEFPHGRVSQTKKQSKELKFVLEQQSV